MAPMALRSQKSRVLGIVLFVSALSSTGGK